MYLLPQNSAPVNNRKWNLGRLGCGCSERGISTPPTKRVGLGRMGDSTAGLPAGSQLTYDATFLIGAGATGVPLNLINVVQAMKTALSSGFGIQVTGQYLGTNPDALLTNQRELHLTVLTQSDRNSQNDVKSILDGLVYQLGSATVNVANLNSSINLINAGVPTPPGTDPNIDPNTGLPKNPQPFDIGQFLSDYGLPIGLGVGALILVKEL